MIFVSLALCVDHHSNRETGTAMYYYLNVVSSSNMTINRTIMTTMITITIMTNISCHFNRHEGDFAHIWRFTFELV